MQIRWELSDTDVTEIHDFVTRQRDNPFVRRRVSTNIEYPPERIGLSIFWQISVGCLLSSQQRSGPDSPVSRFLGVRPFPLPYEFFHQPNAESRAQHLLTQFGGIRFTKVVPQYLVQNYRALDEGLWEQTRTALQDVILERSIESERRVAEFIRKHYIGFGPKQSRNLLQGLGISQYEIPVDSRITKWLNRFGFPLRLNATALADSDYYNFVSDGIQAMCEQSGVLPCVLDAAIFASYDGDGWTEENVVW